MSLLKVTNLTKTYGSKETKVIAVDNISFTVQKGEFIAILGSSGSGKSTLLHMIGGVDTPTKGQVFIDEINVYSLTDEEQSHLRRSKVSIIYQFYNLISTLNVKENIILPLELDNKKVDDNYLEEVIDLLGLKSRLKHLPNELSGGEQQRVAIGRALITKPSIILADEPTGNLDSKNTYEVMDLLKRANKQLNQTIIMVTHDETLAKYTNRIIRIADGKIISDTVQNEDTK